MNTLLATFDPVARWTESRLVDGSLQGALLIFLVWIVCRVTKMTPKARAVLWWIASAKLVLSVLAIPGLPLRVLPAAQTIEHAVLPPQVEPIVSPLAPVVMTPGLLIDDRSASHMDDSTPALGIAAAVSPNVSSLDVLIGCWFLVVLVHAAVLCVASRRVRRVIARASQVSAQEMREAGALAQRLGVRPPRILTSDAVTSPQAVGVWRPAILLPDTFTERVTADEWRMAVCHELMHVRRRDLLWGWVPALAERLFFFHPLARVSCDQYLLAREAACDAAVVQALDVDAHDYGRMLLRLGVSRATPGFAASAASPSVSLLRRRLEMLQQLTATGTSRAHWLIAAAAIALVPFHLAAQSPQSPNPQRLIVAPTAAAAEQSSVGSADAGLQRQREAQDAVEIARKASAQAKALETERLELEQRLLESRAQQEQAGADAKRLSQERIAGEQQRALDAREDALKEAKLSQKLQAQESAEGAAEAARRSERLALESALQRLKEKQDLLSQTLSAQHPDRIAIERQLQEAMAQLRGVEALSAERQQQLARPQAQLQGVTSETSSIPDARQRELADLFRELQRKFQGRQAQPDVAGRDLDRQTMDFLDQEIATTRQRLDELEAKRRAAQSFSAVPPAAQRLSEVEQTRRAEAAAGIAREQEKLEGLRFQIQDAQRQLGEEEAKLRVLMQRFNEQNQAR